MATGWAGDNAVNEQIDATVKDGIRRAQSRVPQDRRRAGLQYPAYAFASPVKRLTIGTPPIFPATTAAAARTANCASSNRRSQIHSPPEIMPDPLTGSRHAAAVGRSYPINSSEALVRLIRSGSSCAGMLCSGGQIPGF